MTTKETLVHVVTAYDRKQVQKKGHNVHALGIYLQRVNEVCLLIEKGMGIRPAIMSGFLTTGCVMPVCGP